MNQSLRNALLLVFLGLQLPAWAHAAVLAEPGPRPKYDESLCSRAGPAWQAKTSDEVALNDLLKPAPSPQIRRLLDLAGEEVMWWIRGMGEISMSSVPTAFHEANHIVDFQLSACHGYLATYMFAGKTYVTELARGATPPYAIAAGKIPDSIKSRPMGRYVPYFVRAQTLPGNDFTVLLDEFNAYVSAAQLEIDFATTPLYSDISGTVDGNIGGVADFMLYTLCYLKAVQEQNPQAYQLIRRSPLFLAHLQRLWSDGERILSSAQPYSAKRGGRFQIDQGVLDAVYSETYISELDKLSVKHLKQQPGA